jgi:hypothetical protein
VKESETEESLFERLKLVFRAVCFSGGNLCRKLGAFDQWGSVAFLSDLRLGVFGLGPVGLFNSW